MARRPTPPPGPTERDCITRGCQTQMRRMFARTESGKRTTKAMKFHCDTCGNETLPFNPYEVEKQMRKHRSMVYAADRRTRDLRQARLPYRD